MKTINQTVEATFVAPTIQEVIIMLPLMDGLIKVINTNRAYDKYKDLSKEEQEKYNRVWPSSDFDYKEEAMYKVLVQCGFCGSGAEDLLPEGNPLKPAKLI